MLSKARQILVGELALAEGRRRGRGRDPARRGSRRAEPAFSTPPRPSRARCQHVAAAGSGLRLGAGRPKALVRLAGRPLVAWAVEALTRPVVSTRSWSPSRRSGTTSSPRRCPGCGSSTAGRPAPRRSALRWQQWDPAPTSFLRAVDAARPLTPPAVVARVLAALADGAAAVVPVLPSSTPRSSSTTRWRSPAPSRRRRCAACRRRRVRPAQRTLENAYATLADGVELTDDAAVVRATASGARRRGRRAAAKVTVAHDLALAELQVARWRTTCPGSGSVPTCTRSSRAGRVRSPAWTGRVSTALRPLRRRRRRARPHRRGALRRGARRHRRAARHRRPPVGRCRRVAVLEHAREVLAAGRVAGRRAARSS